MRMFLDEAEYPLLESPIEDLFIYEMEKLIHEDASIIPQVECRTGGGKFRLDFVIRRGRKVVAVECDGKGYHTAIDDAERDREILASGFVSRIYRITGRDINFFLYDALGVIADRDKWMFSERGLAIIEQLRSRGDEPRAEVKWQTQNR